MNMIEYRFDCTASQWWTVNWHREWISVCMFWTIFQAVDLSVQQKLDTIDKQAGMSEGGISEHHNGFSRVICKIAA